jgi:hypothetical protein
VSASSEHRLKRLRELIAQLERLPASAERDRMLREVRARVVDVDTGFAPRAFLPSDVDSILASGPGSSIPRKVDAPKPAEDRPRPRPIALPQSSKPVHVPPNAPVRRADAEVAADVLLCLDDSTSFWPGEAEAEAAPAPWTRGLRG